MVDALAKQAAKTRQAPAAVLGLLKSATAAVRHSAVLLGEVTHAANNHKIAVTRPDGTQGIKVIRDAQPRDSRGPGRAARPRDPIPESSSATPADHCVPDRATTLAAAPDQCVPGLAATLVSAGSERVGEKRVTPSTKTVAAREAAKRRRLTEEAATRRRLESIAVAARPRDAGKPTAEDRLKGVLERVHVRIASKAADSSLQP